ncbi:hypothetical protein ACWF94_02035 [Streptomyces sp. NPDC055078]
MTIPQALLLLRLLDGQRPAHFRNGDRRHIEKLAGLLRTRLRTVLPGVAVDADLACRSCSYSRNHQISIGDAAADQIHALAGRLADGPRRAPARSRARPPRKQP